MRLAPIFSTNKAQIHKDILEKGGEGVMLKDVNSPYVHEGRPKSMYKFKRYEEVDAFVADGRPGEEGKGWELLIGDIGFACFTESGKIHLVARCSNLELEQRIEASVCKHCASTLQVNHDNVDGKRRILGTKCTNSVCAKENGGAALNPQWLNRVAEITGQEWTARVYRLKHAVIARWRLTGEDVKAKEDCKVNLKNIERRFVRATLNMDI